MPGREGMTMTLKSERRLAIGAVRAELHRQGRTSRRVTAYCALTTLDDIARQEPDLLASYWYTNASENQIMLFKREWNKMRLVWVD